MRKILITGFKTFLQFPVNSSWEVARRLPSVIGDFHVSTKLVPVSFASAGTEVFKEADMVQPDVILCLGQAAKRSAITPEYVAINLRHATVPDNDAYAPQDEPVVPGGPAAYFSTLPVRKMAKAMAASGVAAEVSYTAGTFVCNDLMYKLLHRYQGSGIDVGFIHVPLFAGQEASEGIALDDLVQAVINAIEVL